MGNGPVLYSSSADESVLPETPPTTREKRVVFIRHGCTYMNEYLGMPGKQWGSPNFSDVFPDTEEYRDKYQDSVLSRRGIGQAKSLGKRLVDLLKGVPRAHHPLRIKDQDKDFLNDLDLVVVSPLRRGLETMALGLLPCLQAKEFTRTVPIVALPEAAERLYLISDIGTPRSELESLYGDHVDFETGFWRDGGLDEEWWFRLDNNAHEEDGGSHPRGKPSGVSSETYVEWRPSDQNQEYACPGEPDPQFDERMRRLYAWLQDRPETTIAVVCHWGVIDWMLDLDFGNCELRIVPFDEIQPIRLVAESNS